MAGEKKLGDIILLILSLAIILLGAEFFTNGVEWLGKKLRLGEGAVGSILAAVGTALPETMIPVIAVLFNRGTGGQEVGVGAILGVTFYAWNTCLVYCRECNFLFPAFQQANVNKQQNLTKRFKIFYYCLLLLAIIGFVSAVPFAAIMFSGNTYWSLLCLCLSNN